MAVCPDRFQRKEVKTCRSRSAGRTGSGDDSCRLYFWRTKSGTEVDFVLYGPDTFCAIEVKNTKRIHSKMVGGLLAFQKDYPEAQAFLLYRGKEAMKIKGIMCLPCEDFLKSLKPQTPIGFQ